MTKQDSNLTHHEELRLDYLQKNIHYLNDKERNELAYLQYKAETGRPLLSRRKPFIPTVDEVEELEDFPSYHNDDDWTELTDIEDMVEEEVLLPQYPRHKKGKPSLHSIQIPEKKKVRKKKKGRIKRFLLFLAFIILAVLLGLGFMFVKGMNSVDQKPVAEPFHGQTSSKGVNILILGTDGRVGDSSDMTRTDSIMVLNINNRDKKAKLVSFMRDTLIDIDGADYKLNVAYTFGEQNGNQGAENVREVLKENFDIDVQYYALVDFSTFATAIDTLFPKGVTIDAKFATIAGQPVSSVDVPDDLRMENGIVPNQTIAVGLQQMDGRTLLNYARFRKDDEGDYGRTKRQQQVLAAIMTQVKDPTKLFTGAEALGKVYALTSTNIPQTFILTNGLFAALDARNGIEQTTIPALGDWVDEYDVYGGLGLKIDFGKYQNRLSELGLR
ncbi:LytR family transcriptional regulator [Streptococcus sp. zg-86]|uniref:Regulatory protein MsrR n=1 Tax=Streptococcus zhangguiae TaxID=2664091 RepID=A0A6I4RL91_9STRE|nr:MULTISPECIES: LCP family protein [unclassified Streptococcus]MTB65213.1 LytR family transcriptional regulator [Streptococcus sp. zg-86]MTB91505.1 LytR family transcriptional regulator [Streptococcus sp. zg-36]MWV57201.1 LytR family transcriptional regulator [Streptococcus sp. zg-70]QTH48423.1 LCP family protein [Streptococcus sp. zg-86]